MKCKNCGHEVIQERDADSKLTDKWKHGNGITISYGNTCMEVQVIDLHNAFICGCLNPVLGKETEKSVKKVK